MRGYTKYEEVIELLKNGCEIYTHSNEIKGRSGQTLYYARIWEVSDCKDISESVHHNTIEKLKSNKIILDKKPYTFIGTK